MSLTTTIATIRHGETEYNAEKRYAGSIDVSLNNNGRNDTKIASRNLLELMSFDVVVSSQMKRAIETAQYFAKKKTIYRTALCNERNYGAMEGLRVSDVKSIFPQIQYLKAGNDYHSLTPPEGETFEELHYRAHRFYQHIFNEFIGKVILVVSHGVFLQQFHSVIKNQEWKSALKHDVKNLECNLWIIKKHELVKTKTINIAEREQNSW